MKKLIFLAALIGVTGCDILPKRSDTKLLKSPCACVQVEASNV